ncbi:MAG: serine hydrolase [bacterium]|nr:serine hydrolase [bacterium]
MRPQFKIILISFLISLPFWWGTNLLGEGLEEFFYWQRVSKSPQLLAAQIGLEERLREIRPVRENDVQGFELNAKSGISVFVSDDGREKVLFEKDPDQRLPFASLTKLMTAWVVLEYYDLSKEITVSREAVSQEEDFGKLETGNVFPTEYLLYPLLMESSNDAAFALASDYEDMTERKFVELMKWEAEKMNLEQTFFDNATGLDPEESGTRLNYSSSKDLAKLVERLLKKPLVWEISSTEKYNSYGPELVNNNELLGQIPGLVGGKTGYTAEAGECMILVLRAPKNQGYLINVILGTGVGNKFAEMKELVNWLDLAYRW